MVESLGSSDLAVDQSESSESVAAGPDAADAADIIDTAWRSQSGGAADVAEPVRADAADVIDTAWKGLNDDAGDIIDTAWQSVKSDSGAALRSETVPLVSGDTDRLRELFEHLFRNSVEHGSTGSRAESGDSVEHGGDAVTVRVGPLDTGFYVEDDGPGIPDEHKESVFDHRFTTMDDGHGYGLSIVRTIVNAHGWEIVATDSESGGAGFEITGVEPESTADAGPE